MIGNLKDMASLAGLMKDLPRIKEKLEEIRQHLDEVTVEAETGGGAVRVVADGKLRVTSVRVEPALLRALVDTDDADDRRMAEDLLAGAVNAALEKARLAAEDAMRQAATDMGVPLPPGGLDGFLK